MFISKKAYIAQNMIRKDGMAFLENTIIDFGALYSWQKVALRAAKRNGKSSKGIE